jgi:hypothetical protein
VLGQREPDLEIPERKLGFSLLSISVLSPEENRIKFELKSKM